MEKLSRTLGELNEVMKKLSDAQNDVCTQVTKTAQEFGLTDVLLGSKSEYDDNNYYNQSYLEKVLDCKGMELESYDIDEGTHLVVEFIKELVPKNSTNFIAGKVKLSAIVASRQEEIDEFKESFEYNHDVVDVVVELIKNDIPLDMLEKCMEFLSTLVNLDHSCVPSNMLP
jgi:hypothetical protein